MKRPFFFLTIILHCLTLCSKVWPSAWELALAYRWKLGLFIIRAGPGNDTIFIFFSQAYCSYPTWNKIVGKVLVYFDCLNMSKTKKKVIRHGQNWTFVMLSKNGFQYSSNQLVFMAFNNQKRLLSMLFSVL